MQWSHDLLSDTQRDMLDQLSVFRGSWTLEAVEAVSDGRGTLETLARLVDQSLIMAEPDGTSDMRYPLPEPVRQFAEEPPIRAESLASSGIVTRYFLALPSERSRFVGQEPARLLDTAPGARARQPACGSPAQR